MTSSQPFEHTMASNTSRYCSQFDFPEYLGTGVDVNPDRLGGRRATAGVCFLASSSSVLLDINLSEYSISGGLSAWLSGTSLPDVVLSGPLDVNKARFHGIYHRLSLWTTSTGSFDKVVIGSLQLSRTSGGIHASVSAGVPASGG